MRGFYFLILVWKCFCSFEGGRHTTGVERHLRIHSPSTQALQILSGKCRIANPEESSQRAELVEQGPDRESVWLEWKRVKPEVQQIDQQE